ncbi:MAG: hypothetical protein COA43_11850 [Robiginitomaculum sp.]|nr:MAG: hypothetical protein COA43_11850 [Robiginitomaculum sp.]
MSALLENKINERLVPFTVAGESDGERTPLAELDIFHEQFVGVEELPPAREIEVERTYAQGVQDGRLLAQHESAQNLKIITELVASFQAEFVELGEHIESSHRRTVSGLIRAVLPQLAAQNTGHEISQFLSQISGQALHGEVILNVNPMFESEMNKIVDEMVALGGEAPEFSVVPDEGMGASAVNAKWESGGASIDIDGAVTQCLALLTPEDITPEK